MFFPKIKPPLTIAKRNVCGQLITNPRELKKVYLDHFIFRMRDRPILPGMEQYQNYVEIKFQEILRKTKDVSVPDWTMQDLDRVLNKLKISQSPDRMNLVNELFILKNIGEDLKTSLLMFFNKIKNSQYVPDCLKKVFITSIPKKGKLALNIEEERGIFLVSKLRGILSKLIYNLIIDIIEDELSPSNIGARRNKSPRDHLFVVNAVVNETVQGEDDGCKDLVFSDVSQCFDSLWTNKTLLDLYSNGVQSHLLNLIHELSKSANIVIKTPVGNSEEGVIEDTIMQGENLSSILCTSTMDKMSKDSGAKLLKYRGEVDILKMGFCDDILDANRCGNDIKKMHEETVDELNKRKLQVNKDKSVRIHISSKKGREKECKDLFVDSWSVVKEETDKGVILKDVYNGKHKVKNVESYEYLGNIIQKEGSNKETIKERAAKGQGAIRDIHQILEKCLFGDYHIEALKTLRNAKLMSVLTYNTEVLHNFSDKEVKMLDRVDLQLLRKTMMLSSKSTRSLILLELGLVSVEFTIKQKRLNFLHHLLTEDEESLAKKVLLKQMEKPIKGDYMKLVLKDLKDCKISLSFEEIKNTSKLKFKELVKSSIEKASFERLIEEKKRLSKGNTLVYEELKTQQYLLPGNGLTLTDKRRIFQIRIRDLPVKGNFNKAFNDSNCSAPGCSMKETQNHLYESSCWLKNGEKKTVSVNQA